MPSEGNSSSSDSGGEYDCRRNRKILRNNTCKAPHTPMKNDHLSIGTLRYTFPKLVMLFIWLLLGSFGFALISSAVPVMLPLTLREMNANNLLIGLLVGSTPALINMLLNPIISVRSDRTRTSWGRRRPYLLIATPAITMLMLLIGWSGRLLQIFGVPEIWIPAIAIGLTGVLIVGYQVFYLFVGSTIYYLFVDVVPLHYLGRYMALFNLICSLKGFIFNRWFVKYAENAAPLLYTGLALFFLVCMLVMILLVKEGSYPPIKEEAHKVSLWKSVKIYFRECFTIPFYLCLFLAVAINSTSTVCRSLFGVFFAQKNLGLSLEDYGIVQSYCALLSMCLAIPFGWLNDKIHPLKVQIGGACAVVLANIAAFVLIKEYTSFMVCMIIIAAAYALQNSSALPLTAALFPRSRYGQFGSAQAVFVSVILIAANTIGGIFMDWVKDYRYLFAWDFVLTFAAIIALLVVYRYWKRYGGERNFQAPEA